MGETPKWSHIPMNLVTIDGGWWQHGFFNIDTMISYGLRQCVLSNGHVI